MANMNLASQNFEVNQEKKEIFSGGGVVAIVVVFILTLILYAALFFLRIKTDGNIENARSEYSSKYNSFINSNAKDAVDFKDRLNLAKASTGENIFLNENMTEIEKLIIAGGVHLSSYSYDDKAKTVSLNCLGKDYNTVARQILSFKKSSYFSGVVAGKTSYDPKSSLVGFNVELKLK